MHDIRCFSCNKAIGHLYAPFESYSDPKKGFDELGIVRVCCRRMILSRSHHVDEIAPRHSNRKRDLDENGTSLDAFCEGSRTVSCD